MSDVDDAAAALAEATVLDSSPQAEALAEAVAQAIADRPPRPTTQPDPAVLAQLLEHANSVKETP